MSSAATRPCGADVLLECLIRHGVDLVFAYPGGATLPIHQALTRVKDRLRTILPRHEQGGGFAASGYARATGKIGVCFATSGPGATNLVTCLADAQRQAVPMLAITGQVHRAVLGTDAFQEIPIVSMCRAITKHHYLVTRIEDLTRIIREALCVATTGRPGPVIVDVPKNIQAQLLTPDFNEPLTLTAYDPTPCAGDMPRVSPPRCSPDPVVRRLWQLVRQRGRLDSTVVTSGHGPAARAVAGSWQFPAPGHWVHSDSLGAIGFALPAALGVQAGCPAKTVVAVDTPSSFLSNVHELACAFVEKLPVKVLLLHPGHEEPDVDFPALARGFRVAARRVEHAVDLDSGLTDLLDSRSPFLLEIALPCHDHEFRIAVERAAL
jgi:thiamine pyrophosphate-dependent acetolactate synthase large subunit-like protein